VEVVAGVALEAHQGAPQRQEAQVAVVVFFHRLAGHLVNVGDALKIETCRANNDQSLTCKSTNPAARTQSKKQG